MLDREGYRPNVGIILVNAQRGVLGKRIANIPAVPARRHQTRGVPEQAMYRSYSRKSDCAPSM